MLARLPTVTVFPFWLYTPFQPLVIVCVPGKTKSRLPPLLIALEVELKMVIFVVKPPVHWLTAYVIEQPVVPGMKYGQVVWVWLVNRSVPSELVTWPAPVQTRGEVLFVKDWLADRVAPAGVARGAVKE